MYGNVRTMFNSYLLGGDKEVFSKELKAVRQNGKSCFSLLTVSGFFYHHLFAAKNDNGFISSFLLAFFDVGMCLYFASI